MSAVRREQPALERRGLGLAAPCANCHPSAGQDKPEGDSGHCGLQSVLGQEPPVQPEKNVSKWKVRGGGAGRKEVEGPRAQLQSGRL